jgi:hypothetical protein
MYKSFHGKLRVPYFWVRVSELQKRWEGKGRKERAGSKAKPAKLNFFKTPASAETYLMMD